MKKPRQYGIFPTSEKENRRTGGSIAKARGASFEKELEGANLEYRRHGVALIERVHPAVAGPPGKMRIIKKGPLDFMGSLKGGRSVFFDAKTREDPASFAYDPRDQHQIETLVDAKMCGAIAFVLISDSTRDLAYVLHGEALDSLRRGDRVQLRDRSGRPMFPVVPKRPAWRHGRPTVWDYLAVVERVCKTTPNLEAEPAKLDELSRKP